MGVRPSARVRITVCESSGSVSSRPRAAAADGERGDPGHDLVRDAELGQAAHRLGGGAEDGGVAGVHPGHVVVAIARLGGRPPTERARRPPVGHVEERGVDAEVRATAKVTPGCRARAASTASGRSFFTCPAAKRNAGTTITVELALAAASSASANSGRASST
jgi:hypothetical protein